MMTSCLLYLVKRLASQTLLRLSHPGSRRSLAIFYTLCSLRTARLITHFQFTRLFWQWKARLSTMRHRLRQKLDSLRDFFAGRLPMRPHFSRRRKVCRKAVIGSRSSQVSRRWRGKKRKPGTASRINALTIPVNKLLKIAIETPGYPWPATAAEAIESCCTSGDPRNA